MTPARRMRFFALLACTALCLPGCIATTNYYTGRTAPDGVWVTTPGADDILIGNPEEEDFFIEKDEPLYPSIGLARGMAHRFELGARWYIPYMLESNLRWQVTPRTMERFAMSANLHYGVIGIWAAYIKYGLTVSTDIWYLQPFTSFYLFRDGGLFGDPDDDWEDLLKTNRVWTCGLGIEIPGGLLIPEVNYQYEGEDYDRGFLFFGIGLRVGDRLTPEQIKEKQESSTPGKWR